MKIAFYLQALFFLEGVLKEKGYKRVSFHEKGNQLVFGKLCKAMELKVPEIFWKGVWMLLKDNRLFLAWHAKL